MDEFIIEDEIKKIPNIQTKEYLKEVLSSYHNGNYRSAIVVLYSVVVYDLMNKLILLDEIYSDNNAKRIIDKIKNEQKLKPTSSDWEKTLLQEIKDSTELINDVEFHRINELVKERNIAAHPLIDNGNRLINPTPENVRNHMRNMFEIVFEKEALLCKKIIDEFLKNTTDYFERVRTEGLEDFLNVRYYSRINKPVREKLFESLWKLTFILDNSECEKNRYLNVFCIKTLTEKHLEDFINLIKQNSQKFNNIKPSNFSCSINDKAINQGSSRITALTSYISKYPEIYNVLDSTVKNYIQIEANKNISLFTVAYFLSNSIEAHISKIEEIHDKILIEPNGYVNVNLYDCIQEDALMQLYNRSKIVLSQIQVKTFLINYCGKSFTYYSALSTYDNIISKILNDFDNSDFELLFKLINENGEFYNNNEIYRITKQLKDKSSKILGPNFDYTKYDKIFKN
ncbi:MAG TPA: hypothetical protein PLK90_02905 [Clostridiales bacterium]|nr:hypothetical protein [Clostridiales bacterium]HQP69328.1 hypothetical protein [Clostridiales bacterium]